ncbi:hypothetical protein CANCADRAFT_44290 [Tortispora caseinolytica NRRL Y-17796]|uniref:Chromatin modification-related protein EAF7 n=1 Tax=Tortispora caseinolytica NRRL Y-17796 TaxID=767744 RepID=A0A1E4TFV0_9ASCO|nr:hypothetical protein CANCADRAFT_44290 [Tortispora caseinolytica NRRL Y-17796]
MTQDWSLTEETSLFKAICKCKPAGIHKHFHMINIRNLIKHHQSAEIWEKLRDLYDLDAIDKIEEGTYDDEQDDEPFKEFTLPLNNYDFIQLLEQSATNHDEQEQDEDEDEESDDSSDETQSTPAKRQRTSKTAETPTPSRRGRKPKVVKKAKRGRKKQS